jgi:hypothetical protein
VSRFVAINSPRPEFGFCDERKLRKSEIREIRYCPFKPARFWLYKPIKLSTSSIKNYNGRIEEGISSVVFIFYFSSIFQNIKNTSSKSRFLYGAYFLKNRFEKHDARLCQKRAKRDRLNDRIMQIGTMWQLSASSNGLALSNHNCERIIIIWEKAFIRLKKEKNW